MPIAIPIEHPELSLPSFGAAAGGDYPLLTLPEKRQSLHSHSAGGSTRPSLQVERSGSSIGSNRVSLPRSVSIDLHRRSGELIAGRVDKGKGRAVDTEIISDGNTFQIERKVTIRQRSRSPPPPAPEPSTSGITFDRKGKGKEILTNMSTDLERGPETQEPYNPGGTSTLPTQHNNDSRTSIQSGIGPALSSTNSSIIGTDGPAGDAVDEWGPQHPCFPHMNPHVPLTSPLYQTTRIIRIRRDWMIKGDLAPTFANLYPEILDPAGVSEQEFRTVVERVNVELVEAFNPWSLRNIVDGVLGLVTGWVWDDVGAAGVKGRLEKVEAYLESWNKEMEGKFKKDGNDGSEGLAPRIVPLRRTGYMNVSSSCTRFTYSLRSISLTSGIA